MDLDLRFLEGQPLRLRSALTAREASEILSEKLSPEDRYYTSHGGWASWIVGGRASPGDVQIWAHDPDHLGRDSLRSSFRGSIRDLAEGGSELAGTFGPAPGMRYAPIPMAGFPALFTLVGLAGIADDVTLGHYLHAGLFLGFAVGGSPSGSGCCPRSKRAPGRPDPNMPTWRNGSVASWPGSAVRPAPSRLPWRPAAGAGSE